MAIEVNHVKANPRKYLFNGVGGNARAAKGFEVVESDANYLAHPLDDTRPVVTEAISLNIDTEDIKVEFWDGSISVIPAGVLEAKVKHPMNIVKVFDTGTGATVRIFAWIADEPLG